MSNPDKADDDVVVVVEDDDTRNQNLLADDPFLSLADSERRSSPASSLNVHPLGCGADFVAVFTTPSISVS
jgi:hypothetical protein